MEKVIEEFKGTKGEWIVGVANVKDSNKDELVISKKGGEKVDRGYRLVARISPMDDYDDIDISNAKLIAAAPDMLEACLRFVEDFEGDYMVGGEIVDNPHHTLISNYKQAKKAIQKALK